MRKDSIFTLSSELPQELITEILLRLEVKPLLKFRCVSKSWLSLISSSEFAKTHVLLSSKNKNYTHRRVISRVDHSVMECSISSVVNDNVVEAFDLDYPDKMDNCYPWIVGSANGLICLVIGVRVGIGISMHSMFLWNPSIRKYKKLPSCGLEDYRYHSNVYEASNFGFAHDEPRDDYKIVCTNFIFRNRLLDHEGVRIYSLKSDSWRQIDDFQGKEMKYAVRNGSPGLYSGG